MKKVVVFSLMMLMSASILADDDEHEERGWFGWASKGKQTQMVDNSTYREECGSCHMAYPPALLPTRSWQKIMDGLQDHFGDNAELEAKTTEDIRSYLVSNAADRNDSYLSRKVLRGAGDAAPLRITELPYIKREHAEELPRDIFQNNEKLTSLSQCDACHTQAKQGSFRESEIRIPGRGRWRD